MKNLFQLSIATVLLLTGCTDDELAGRQDVVYVDLNDARAGYNQPYALDVDSDGGSEFVFNATLIADAIGDHLRFAVISRYDNAVIGENGNVKVLHAGDPVVQGSAFGYDNEVLAIKTTTPGGVTWWGNWKGAQNKYIGIRFRLSGSTCYGWVRVSLSESEERIVIHDMAYGRGQDRDGIPAGVGDE